MCCYCIEEHILALIPGTIFFEENNSDLINALPDGFLQESADLEIAIIAAKESPHFPKTKVIFLCKMLETFIENQYEKKLYTMYCKNYKTRSHNNNLPYQDFVNFFHNDINFTSEESWEHFVNNQKNRDNVEKLLTYYSTWWIDGIEDKMHDQIAYKKAIEEKIDIFELIFPAVFFSLCFSIKNKINTHLVEKIALKCPGQGRKTLFACNDLWLQRKALIACVKNQGHNFLIKHLEIISENHIHYILAKFQLDINIIEIILNDFIKFSSKYARSDWTYQMLVNKLHDILKNQSSNQIK